MCGVLWHCLWLHNFRMICNFLDIVRAYECRVWRPVLCLSDAVTTWPLLWKAHAPSGCHVITPVSDRLKVAVIPYIHKLSHNIVKTADRSKVKVVFFAPQKLIKLCNQRKCFRAAHKCNKKHKNPFVTYVSNMNYCTPLSCGKQYIGQTGRCINDQLREHSIMSRKTCMTVGLHVVAVHVPVNHCLLGVLLSAVAVIN